MDFKLIFGLISMALAIVSFFPYIRDILLKKTQPHIYSWLVWSILQSVGVIAMFIGGAKFGSLGLAVGALFCISIFFLCFKYGTKNITIFDSLCLSAAIIVIFVWLFQKDPTLSVILITLIDFMAFLPTYRKGFTEPKTETISTYLISAISNFFALFAVENYSIVTSLYITSLVITNIILVLILVFRRKILSAKTQ